ncbi:MAG: GxxExxY protein [Prevotellaceae bacterium]|nr:GxxExxY protein [Prevotellaceae bacterium]
MLKCKQYADIVYKIIGAAMEVHGELSYGLLEPVYQEALHLELLDRRIDNEREKEIRIYYKNHLLDKSYKMDIVVGDVIVELKSVRQIVPAHRAQLCNYLRLTKKPLGLLINFGEESLIGERWAYEEETNDCYLVDRNMNEVFDADYNKLLYQGVIDSEDDDLAALSETVAKR